MLIKTLLALVFTFALPALYSTEQTPPPQSYLPEAKNTPTVPTLTPIEHSMPELPSSEDMTSSYKSAFIRMLLSLAGLLGLVFLTFWMLKKMGKGKFKVGSHRAIQILEKRSLSPKTVLYVVEVDGQQILISESQLEVRALKILDPVTEETS